MRIIKQIKSDKGSTTIQGAYILIFSVIIFALLISLGKFYYQKQSTQTNAQLLSLKIANKTINENEECSKAIKETLSLHNQINKSKIQIKKYKCEKNWVQIQITNTINILQMPININSISRAGINEKSVP